jgi:hypothetical protein
MPLDPIVSLSVALAEGPGSYAFFLGSGASRDAGVPTGVEVYWRGIGELYRLETASGETPDRAVLAEWLLETDRGDLGYSDLLEILAPDQATRREYLARNFEGVEPGATHHRLGELASRGVIRVFVTTNFDRLLEHALQSRGIEPIVVTCDADLQTAPNREHADCYVVKPHGDYLQQTIRNTPDELAELEPGMSSELQEVFDRYGLVVLGYSGNDEAISRIFATRRSRYGLYWVSRGQLVEPARSIVEAGAARLIIRPGSDDFLEDLDLRLGVFEAQPSGLTPVAVNDQTTRLLDRGEIVGLHELLRRERHEFERRVETTVASYSQNQPTVAIAGEIYDELLPVLERRLASLLPLILYRHDLFTSEVDTLADFVGRQPLVGGYSFYPDIFGWCVWWLALVIGGFAVRMRQLEVLKPLLSAQVVTRYNNGVEPLITPFENDACSAIGRAVTARRSDRRWIDPPWHAVLQEGWQLQLLAERYPELVRSETEFQRALVEYDFVLSAAMALAGRRTFARWSMYGEVSRGFAQRLRADPTLRAAVADVADVTLDDFDARAADALDGIQKLGQFPEVGAISVLRIEPAAAPED